MFKTISAAVIAVSVLAAPAFAGSAKIIHGTPVKASVLNANARMGHHHYRHFHRHFHKHMGALRTHAKVSFHHASPVKTKRG
jgi:hypothetical protein